MGRERWNHLQLLIRWQLWFLGPEGRVSGLGDWESRECDRHVIDVANLLFSISFS